MGRRGFEGNVTLLRAMRPWTRLLGRICGWECKSVCAWLSRNVWHTTFHFCSFSSPQPLAVALECTTPRTALTKVLVGSLIPRPPTLLLVTCSIEERLGGWGSGNEALLMLCEVCLYKLLKILVSWQC